MNIKILANILAVFLIYSNIHAQQLNGLYQDNNGFYLNFLPNNKIKFLLSVYSSHDSIGGYGTYKIKHKRMYIKTNPKFNVSASRIEIIPNSNSVDTGTFKLHVFSVNKVPFFHAQIIYKERSWKFLQTDSAGRAEFKLTTMPIDSIIYISLLGYQPVSILLDDIKGGMYSITLVPGDLRYIFDDTFLNKFTYKNDTIKFTFMKDENVITLTKQKPPF
jgi:hypothetical protein